MRKRINHDADFSRIAFSCDSLDLGRIAIVEVSSERCGHPIESALLPGHGMGWRAEKPGKQTIRLLFDQSQAIISIQLAFFEPAIARTQEYVVRASSDHGQSFLEIVRQQWNFHSQGGETELEHHVMNLPAVNILEVIITPNIHDSGSYASLERLRLF